ncbi:hypothetical protein Pcinc_025246 [Petrolisthes cinctipes]|uniref:Secreted protein n=1 Tax=Petrolisthes cinctipes TaxID=88211 RepID=A0AAE1F8D9_PETCI|nr:hypothetical protein Pcinc_025246 [Petrolisthes cinctipes]
MHSAAMRIVTLVHQLPSTALSAANCGDAEEEGLCVMSKNFHRHLYIDLITDRHTSYEILQVCQLPQSRLAKPALHVEVGQCSHSRMATKPLKLFHNTSMEPY